MHTVRWPRRVVLDSMYFRGANDALVAQLERMRARHGCSFHLSAIVIIEAFASADVRGLGAVLGPLTTLRDVLDSDEPLLPCDLYAPPNPTRVFTLGRRSRRELREVRRMWDYVTSPDVQKHGANSASIATKALGDRSSMWLDVASRAETEFDNVFRNLDNAEGYRIVAEYLLTTLEIDRRLWRRLDAHARVRALRMVRAGRGSEATTPNDDVDHRLLLHLFDGCLVATRDKKLLADIAQSGTHQAPWVRSLDEFENAMPDGAPW